MKTRTNKTCASCTAASNTINGRYCIRLRRYVEYADSPQCVTNHKEVRRHG